MGGGVILPSPVAEMKKEIQEEVWAEANVQLSELDQQLSAKDQQLSAKDQQLSELEQRNAELEAMVISLGGKV
ncbi:MAG: hypothetical protein IKR68_03285 [Lachnospiraceae bacterium]|nr:hypothetical protein [Lachnospiraceae bacterium]